MSRRIRGGGMNCKSRIWLMKNCFVAICSKCLSVV